MGPWRGEWWGLYLVSKIHRRIKKECFLRTLREGLGPGPLSWKQVGASCRMQPLGFAQTIRTEIDGVILWLLSSQGPEGELPCSCSLIENRNLIPILAGVYGFVYWIFERVEGRDHQEENEKVRG